MHTPQEFYTVCVRCCVNLNLKSEVTPDETEVEFYPKEKVSTCGTIRVETYCMLYNRCSVSQVDYHGQNTLTKICLEHALTSMIRACIANG